MMLRILLALAVLVAGRAVVPPAELLVHEDPVRTGEDCRPAEDLEPEASEGDVRSVPSTLAADGTLSRWMATEGQTLRLKIRGGEPGAYEILVSAMRGVDGAELSAGIWDVPLTHQGQANFALAGTDPARMIDVRFDPVALGPGYHVLELECTGAGEVLLDCVGLCRTGDATEHTPPPPEEMHEPAFLGVELETDREGGVTIRRAIPDSAASRAGLQAGDVLLTIGGVPAGSTDEARDAITAHPAGARVELVLLRDGERVTRQVELGRRPELAGQRVARAEHVIEVLQVRPGQVIADIGCGSGWLAHAIAEAVGPEGTIYAVEIQERHVRGLRRRPVPNVVPVLSVADDVALPEDSLDVAMLHDVASHIDRGARPRFYESVTRALKRDGRLAVFGPHGRAPAMLSDLRRYGFIPVNDDELTALSPGDLDQRLKDGIVFRRE
jgi:SAM-dependent methyltransferase